MFQIGISLLFEEACKISSLFNQQTIEEHLLSDARIAGVRLLTSDVGIAQAEGSHSRSGRSDVAYLYVADEQPVPDAPTSAHASASVAAFTSTSPHVHVSAFATPPQLVFVPSGTMSAAQAIAILQDAFESIRVWYEDSLRLICQNAGVVTLLNSTATMLDNPVAYLDETGSLIHKTGTFENDVSGTVWENIQLRGFCNPNFFNEREHTQFEQKLGAKEEIISGVFENDPAHRFVVIPLFEGNTYCGSLASIDINASYTPGQEERMRLLGQLVILANSRQNAIGANNREAPYCIGQLLKGNPVAEGELRLSFAKIGWITDDTFFLFRLRASSLGNDESLRASTLSTMSTAESLRASTLSTDENLINRLEKSIKPLIPHAIWILHESGYVALCRKKDFDASKPEVREKLEERLARLSVRCGISSSFSGFADIRVQHTQCMAVLRSIADDESSCVAYFDQHYQSVLKQTLQQTADWRSLCHPAVLRLAQSAKPQDAILLSNLKEYLLNGCSVAATARMLHVHRNTLLYRLDKLQSLLDKDLRYLDQESLAYLLASCLLVSKERTT